MTGAAIDADEPLRIRADRISYDPAANTYAARGRVVITHRDFRLEAEEVLFVSAQRIVRASGNVFFTSGEDTLEGDRLVMDIETRTGVLHSGHIFITEKNFHIRGERIEKTGENTYFLEQVCLTTCEPENPDWSITGTNVNVTVEGYGTVKHAAFRVRQVPVFYLPYFVFPAKTQRQSGLLLPDMAYSAKNGFEFVQPWFWALSDHSDVTFYYHHIQNRGEKAGIEYRYMKSPASGGAIMIDGFEDRKVDDDPGDPNRKWGYTDDGLLRPNSDRYWFRMKADQELPAEFMARLDLDIVSDPDYLHDFSDRYTGRGATEQYFESAFGRGIDDAGERQRENRLNVMRTWTSSSFNTDWIWYDDAAARRGFYDVNRGRKIDENTTLQRLPAVRYNILKQPVYQNRLYGSIHTGYDYFYREDGVTGHRMDIHPRLSFPLHPAGHFTFEPSAGYRQTAWYVDADREDILADGRLERDMNRYTHRGIYDIAAELSTDVHRTFQPGAFTAEKMRHRILPEIRYSYIPETNQSGFPDFDEIDRIDKENRITASMTHFLTSRRTATRPDTDPEPAYSRFARFMIEQPYEFRPEEEDDSLLPLFAELDITPAGFFTLHAEVAYDHRENALLSANNSLRFRGLPWGDFRMDYRYTKNRNETVYLEAEAPLRQWLTVYGDYERSLAGNRDIEINAGFRYKADCWSIDVSYKTREDLAGERDEKYFFMLRLHGLGGIGSGS